MVATPEGSASKPKSDARMASAYRPQSGQDGQDTFGHFSQPVFEQEKRTRNRGASRLLVSLDSQFRIHVRYSFELALAYVRWQLDNDPRQVITSSASVIQGSLRNSDNAVRSAGLPNRWQSQAATI